MSLAVSQATYINTDSLDEAFLRNVTCASALSSSENLSPNCISPHCARRVIDDLFASEDIEKLLEIVNHGLSYRTDAGGPSILDINTGYVRDTNGLENLFSREEEVYSSDYFSHYGAIIKTLKEAVRSTFGMSELMFTAPTFITRLDGREGWEPQGIHDEYWHVHSDMNNTAHYQYSGLLYLSTYKKDFTGGLLHFVSPENFSEIIDTVEPRAGRVAIFSSDMSNPHYVERVTSGQRFVLAFWFTCDPSKEFGIFLDGKAHQEFSSRVKSSLASRSSASVATGASASSSSDAAAKSDNSDRSGDEQSATKTRRRRRKGNSGHHSSTSEL